MSSSSVPIRTYLNPDKEKESIINENKGRTGIYRWVCLETGKSYIGSSIKLNVRFKQYFNYNHISNPKRNMRIYRALLKYGYAGFRLEILEYCSPKDLIAREQFYFDSLNPEYNILKVAGSFQGYRHSEATKKLISVALKNTKVSEFTRELKRKALLGKAFDKARIAKMRLSNTFRKPVIITNMETGEVLEFASLTDAGKYIGISRISVAKYLSNNLTYDKYTFSEKGLAPGSSSVDTEVSGKSIACVSSKEDLARPAKISYQAVLLTNQATGDKKEFSSISDAAKYLNVSNGRIWYFFSTKDKTGNETLKGYTISKLSSIQDQVNKTRKQVEITNVETNEVTTYSSVSLAGKALGISQASISLYISRKRSSPFKKKYIFKLV